MAAPRMTSTSWIDTPVNPLLGVSMFVIGATVLMTVALMLASLIFFY